jgi:hypothetical protein
MKSEEIIEAMWSKWQEWEGEDLDKYHSKQEQKIIFLSEQILGITTYDSGLDIEFGNMILETIKHIENKTTFEYIKNENNYREYILSINFIESWLDWGTSIRGAWFNEYYGKITPNFILSNIDYDKEHIIITKGFMKWFIEFLEK